MLQLKNNKIKKAVFGIGVSVLLGLTAVPVCAKTCTYTYDPVLAIGYGNINMEKAAMNPYTYSAYVLGTDPVVVKDAAYYSVGVGGSYNNTLGRTNMHLGSVKPGTTKSTTENKATLMIYNGTTAKVSVSDSV